MTIIWNGDREYNNHPIVSPRELLAIDWGQYLPWTAAAKVVAEKSDLPLENIVVGCRLEMFLSILAGLARQYWTKPAIGTLSPSFSLAFDRLAEEFHLPIVYSFLPENFQTNADQILGDLGEIHGMLWLCNPNNPTGSLLIPTEIARIAQAMPRNLVVIDEAYIEMHVTIQLYHT
jgi:histidinol-phosphate/aromatic aminotransferase/cobyric acid decarboxylase-like protein